MKRIVAIVLALIMVLSMVVSASAVSYRVGSKGSGVVRIQKYLTDNGYGTLTADGKYGTKTAEAVMRFQKAHGLSQDGVCGKKTLTEMGMIDDNDNNPSHSEDDDGNDNSVMKKGSTGPKVKEVQQALKDLKYPVGKVDGTFGAATDSAVKCFQRLNNLKADGKVGTGTWEKLFGGSAAPYNKSVKEKEYTTIKKGSKDTAGNKNAVSRLQKALMDKGYLDSDHGTTGYYDDDTTVAVRSLQSALGLKVDGIAGDETQAALYGN